MSAFDVPSASTPEISVITIFLDARAHLEEAIASVLGQTFRDWELVLVDDGSTDGSTEIARRYAERHPDRIRCIDHRGHANLGTAISRNAGVAAARGRLITFLDADDVWFPRALERLRRELASHPHAAAAIGATEYWHSWRPGAAWPDTIVPVGVGPGVYRPPRLAYRLYPLGRGASPTVSALLVRREHVDAVGGFEERFSGMYEDQSLLLRLYVTAPVVVTDFVCDRYRQRPESINNTARRDGYLAVRASFIEWFREEFSTYDRRDWRVRLALLRVLVPQRLPWLRRLARRPKQVLRALRPKVRGR